MEASRDRGRRNAMGRTPSEQHEDAAARIKPADSTAAAHGWPGASNPMTPPPEFRTDWPRGIGEFGTEEMDPSQPLNEEPIRRQLNASE